MQMCEFPLESASRARVTSAEGAGTAAVGRLCVARLLERARDRVVAEYPELAHARLPPESVELEVLDRTQLLRPRWTMRFTLYLPLPAAATGFVDCPLCREHVAAGPQRRHCGYLAADVQLDSGDLTRVRAWCTRAYLARNLRPVHAREMITADLAQLCRVDREGKLRQRNNEEEGDEAQPPPHLAPDVARMLLSKLSSERLARDPARLRLAVLLLRKASRGDELLHVAHALVAAHGGTAAWVSTTWARAFYPGMLADTSRDGVRKLAELVAEDAGPEVAREALRLQRLALADAPAPKQAKSTPFRRVAV